MANNKQIKSQIWKVLRITTAATLIALFVDLLAIAVRPLTNEIDDFLNSGQTPKFEKLFQPVSFETDTLYRKTLVDSILATFGYRKPRPDISKDIPPHFWMPELPDSTGPIEQTLNFYANTLSVNASYEIRLPRSHPLLVAFQTMSDNEDLNALIRTFLGQIEINSQELAFDFITLDVAEDKPNASAKLTSKQIEPQSQDISVFIRKPDNRELRFLSNEIIVHTTNARVVAWSGFLPVSQSARETIFNRSVDTFVAEGFNLRLSQQHQVQTASPQQTQPEKFGSLIARNFDFPTLPIIGVLIFSLLESLPFLLFLQLKNRQLLAPATSVENYSDVIKLLLIYHFGLYAIDALYLGNFSFHDLNRIVLSLLEFTRLWPYHFYLPRIGPLAFVLFAASLLWPKLVIGWELKSNLLPENKSTLLLIKIVIVVSIILLMLLSILFIFGHIIDSFRFMRIPLVWFKKIPLPWFMLTWISLFFCGLFCSSSWLLREVFGSNATKHTMILGTVLLAFLAIVQNFYFGPGLVLILINISILIPIAARLLFSFGKVMYFSISEQSFLDKWQNWKPWQKIVLFLILVLLSTWVFRNTIPKWWEIYDLAFRLDNLLYYTLLFFLLRSLHYLSTNTNIPQKSEIIKETALLFALAFFFNPTHRWMYIPVKFILGYLLLSKWLLRLDLDANAIAAKITAKRSYIIKGLLKLKYAQRALKSLRKNQFSKVSNGDLPYKQYRENVETLENEIETMRKSSPLMIGKKRTVDYVFGFGPTRSKWENGIIAAKYAFVFSIPWMLIYFRDLITGPVPQTNYLLFSLLGTVPFTALKWTLYGFFFGYFYNLIRGRNGLEKGFFYFVTLVVPSLAMNLLLYPLDISAWLSFGFWALQVFLHSLLLGLFAGDYETLRRDRFRWYNLIEVYNLTSLSAWVTSILIALGAAIQAMISTDVGDLISKGLKLVQLLFLDPGPGANP